MPMLEALIKSSTRLSFQFFAARRVARGHRSTLKLRPHLGTHA